MSQARQYMLALFFLSMFAIVMAGLVGHTDMADVGWAVFLNGLSAGAWLSLPVRRQAP